MMNESFVVGPTEEGFEIDEEKFECSVCAYTYRFRQSVGRHERRHLTESHAPPDVERDMLSC